MQKHNDSDPLPIIVNRAPPMLAPPTNPILDRRRKRLAAIKKARSESPVLTIVFVVIGGLLGLTLGQLLLTAIGHTW